MVNNNNNGDVQGDEQYVTVVHPNDVLFGRGSGPNDHEGNIKFRDLVAQRKAEYMATNHRQTKAKIARSIVDIVFANNGRFLKKLEPADAQRLGFPNATTMDVYQIADEDTIMEKAKQALRQNRDKSSSVGGSGGVGVGSNPYALDQQAAAAAVVTLGGLGAGVPTSLSRLSPTPPSLVASSNNTHRSALLGSAGMGTAPASLLNPPLTRTVSDQYDMATDPLPVVHPQQQQQQHPPQGPQFIPPPSSSGGGTTTPLYSIRQENYTEDSQGYATYTKSLLPDPEDEQLFTPSTTGSGSGSGSGRRSSWISSATMGSRRGSLLGGRKSGEGLIGGRRDSLQLGDVWRRDSMLGMRGESMQMSELMESFKAMSTTGDLNSSTDTIGTIEGNMFGSSNAHMSGMSNLSNMSVMSMGSTLSLFKTAPSNEHDSGRSSESAERGGSGGPRSRNNSSDMMMSFRTGGNNSSDDLWGDAPNTTSPSQQQQQQQQQQQSQPQRQRDQILPLRASAGGGHRTSINSANDSDMWNSRQLTSLLRAPMEGSSAYLDASSSAFPSTTSSSNINNASLQPRNIQLMEENPDSMSYLGASSLSVLRSVDRSGSILSNTGSAPQSILFDINKNSSPERVLPPSGRPNN